MGNTLINLRQLETDVTTVCNNSCICCDHYIQIRKPGFLSPAQFRDELNIAKRLIHVHDYRLIGGEPSLHPYILDMMDVCRSSDISDIISLWTNGTILQDLPLEFWKWWKAKDEIHITYYPNNPNYGKPRTTFPTKAKLIYYDVDEWYPSFSTTPVSTEHSQFLFDNCTWKLPNCTQYNHGWFSQCASAMFIPLLLNLEEGTDCIHLNSASTADLQSYLTRTKPFLSCRYCKEAQNLKIEWREVPRKTWLKESDYA